MRSLQAHTHPAQRQISRLERQFPRYTGTGISIAVAEAQSRAKKIVELLSFLGKGREATKMIMYAIAHPGTAEKLSEAWLRDESLSWRWDERELVIEDSRR